MVYSSKKGKMTIEIVLLILVILEALGLVFLAVALFWRGRGVADVAGTLQEVNARQMLLEEKMEGLQPLTQQVSTIRTGLAQIQAYVQARQDLERETHQAIHRLERVLAGTQTKGAAGEEMLDLIFSQLPASWQVRNYRVENKVVEFGLLLPNGLILPIDHKWAALPLLEQFLAAGAEEHALRKRLKAQIEATVWERAREVTRYLDPDITTGFALAVVPDAVYDLCRGIQASLMASQVALISHSLLLPYLLLIIETTLRASQSVDLQRLSAYLHNSQQSLRALQEVLEGPFARALKMLENSRDRLTGELSKVQADLVSIQRAARAAGAEAEPRNELSGEEG